MAFLDDILTWAIVLAMIYVAWIYKIKPELDRQKKKEAERKVYKAEFTEIR